MKHVSLGSKKTVSRLGLGLAALGRPDYINLGHGEDLNHQTSVEALEQHTISMLEAASKSGINFFDTARSYGKGEEFLGKWIKSSAKEADASIFTKWGQEYAANFQIDAKEHVRKKYDLKTLKEHFEASKKALGRKIDLYQIHSVEANSPALNDAAILTELSALKEAGVYIGASVIGPKQKDAIEKLLSIKQGEKPLFDSVQVTFNLMEQSAADAMKAAADAGMFVIAKEVFANGRLTEKNVEELNYTFPGRELKKMAQGSSMSPAQIALSWVLGHDFVHAAISGAVTHEQLKQHVQAEKSIIPSSDAEGRKLASVLIENPVDYWLRRSSLPWN